MSPKSQICIKAAPSKSSPPLPPLPPFSGNHTIISQREIKTEGKKENKQTKQQQTNKNNPGLLIYIKVLKKADTVNTMSH